MSDTNTDTDTTGDEVELGEITYTRIMKAPRELVFECMTTPEHLTHFWGPQGMHTPLDKITVELRPGGVFETIMVNDETGEEYPMRGEFVEVVVPERIVFREPGAAGGMTTSITFNDLGDGTTETVTHQTNIPKMFLTPEAQAGMQSSFVKFDEYIATLV